MMALTGIFLIVFLVVHVGLNACIFADLSWLNPADNGEMFNRAAHFMGATVVMRILEIVLFLGFIVHIIQGYVVEAKNRSRRGHGYNVSMGSRGSTWMSRSMALLGTLIFLYLVIHIAQFWVPSRITQDMQEVSYDNGLTKMHNLNLLMFEVFQQTWVVILYLVGVAALGFHLWHGFTSAFRSIGVHNKKYLALLKGMGYGFTVIVCLLFALMPVAMYLQWVNPNS